MWEIIFFEKYVENEAERLIPDLLFFKKAFCKVKASGHHLLYFGRPRLENTIKRNLIAFWTVDPVICSKSLWLASLPYFVNDFSKENISQVIFY